MKPGKAQEWTDREERERKGEGGRAGRKKERESDARTSVSHHLKRESQQLRKAHWTENTTPLQTHTDTHTHKQVGLCFSPGALH